MIIPDVNILIYAHNSDAPEHERARSYWERAVAGPEPVGIDWTVALAFVRLLSNPRVVVRPAEPAELVSALSEILAQPAVRIVAPGVRHAETMERLFRDTGASARLTTDVHLAALAIDLNATLATNDADFSRFRGLRTVNPLDAAG